MFPMTTYTFKNQVGPQTTWHSEILCFCLYWRTMTAKNIFMKIFCFISCTLPVIILDNVHSPSKQVPTVI